MCPLCNRHISSIVSVYRLSCWINTCPCLWKSELFFFRAHIWHVEHGKWNLECGVWNIEHGIWNIRWVQSIARTVESELYFN